MHDIHVPVLQLRKLRPDGSSGSLISKSWIWLSDPTPLTINASHCRVILPQGTADNVWGYLWLSQLGVFLKSSRWRPEVLPHTPQFQGWPLQRMN